MAHLIETYGDQAAFISARQSAWHQLGTVVDDVFTAEEAMEKGHLGGWQVRKLPVPPIKDPVTDQMLVTKQDFIMARTNPFTRKVERLGKVGSAYEVIQNEQHAEFLNTLVGESGAHFETAGSLKHGREMFLTMKLPGHMLVGGQDRSDLYLAATNSHDGTTPFRVFLTMVRIVCANTQHAAIAGAPHIINIRHTSGATERIQQVREALNLSFAYKDAFQAEADRMLETEMTNQEFDKLVAALYPSKNSDNTRTKNTEALLRDTLVDLFKDAPTQDNIRGTRWAAYNAVTEYVDHYSPVKGKDKAMSQVLAARADRALTSRDDLKIKEKAFALLSA